MATSHANVTMDTATGFTHRFTQRMTIAAPQTEVYAALFDMGRWAERLIHVTDIDVLYDDGRNQEFLMTVQSGNDATLQVRSVRCCHDEVIDFFQPVPPPYLTHHGGTWRFTENGVGGTDVEVTHVWDLAQNASDWYPPTADGSTEERIHRVLADHSALALTRWRDLFAMATTDGRTLADISDSVALLGRRTETNVVVAEADVTTDADAMFDAYADLASWPRHFDSVLSANLTYDDGYNQEFTLTVVKDGGVETVRGVRYLRYPHEIEMCHFTPPPGMKIFRCRRVFTSHPDGGSRVSERREFSTATGTATTSYRRDLQALLEQRIRDAAWVASPKRFGLDENDDDIVLSVN